MITLRLAIISILVISVLGCAGSDDASHTDDSATNRTAASASRYADVDTVVWRDYDEGMMELVGSTRFGILYFDTINCAPCYWMDSIFNVPEVVQAIKQDFVPIKIQSARDDTVHYQGRPFTESHMRKLFMLAGYPTTIFIEGQRNQMISARAGRIPPDELLAYFDYLTSKAYKVMDYDEYLQSQEKRETDQSP